MIIEGKVENMNVGSNFSNCNVITAEGSKYNIKLNEEQSDIIKVGKVYYFKVEEVVVNDRNQLHLLEFNELFEYIDDPIELKEKLSPFYNFAPVDPKDVKDVIESYLDKIENQVLKDITLNLYNKYKKKFYIYPAAVRFHHAYIGGLSYHTKSMLRLAEAMMDVYEMINKDLVYSAIILHDLCKVVELSGFEAEEYTKEGQLIGHLVLISQEVVVEANNLGYQDKEEVLLLNHILLAHHGLPNFGAAKRPQTLEALLVWYIDTIDSKFRVITEELELVDDGEFTPAIGVADRMRFYKHKLKK